MSLKGLKALVTAGPTHEPIDPVRFIGNRSSGKQGYAIAEALAEAGADVTLISGPTALQTNLNLTRVETTQEMLAACEQNLPADIAICAAAVSDWAPVTFADHKIKKREGEDTLTLTLKKNPDILRTISRHKNRPKLVIGFAAETQDVLENAQAKLSSKGCDWILANDVSGGKTFSADENHVYLITKSGTEEWPRAHKTEIARQLIDKIAEYFKNGQ